MNIIFISLTLLFIKHWYIDFVNQTMEEVNGKGIYGNKHGLWHSIKHGICTSIIFLLVSQNTLLSISLGLIDFITHYHIDWLKININKKYDYKIDKPMFWVWLGADQLVHSLTYLTLVYIAI